MVMTSAAVRYELCRIDALIGALGGSYPLSEDEIEDVWWLKEQRAHLCALLAVRQAQCGKRLVSLEIWRNGRAGQRAKSIFPRHRTSG